MGTKASLTGQVAQWTVERPERKRTFAEWPTALVASGAAVEMRAAAAKNTEKAAATLRHVAATEAGGQSRLRVFLGGPVQTDEYDACAPDADLDPTASRAAFAATRAATVAPAKQPAAASIPDTHIVAHNSFDPRTARGPRFHLESCATREASRIR